MTRQFITSQGRYSLLLADPISGLPFGVGNTEEEVIADAVANSYYCPEDDENMRQVPCTEAWVHEQIRGGGLRILTPDDWRDDEDGDIQLSI